MNGRRPVTCRRVGCLILRCLSIPLAIPLIVTTNRDIIFQDVERWRVLMSLGEGHMKAFLALMMVKEFRTLYLYRLKTGNVAGALLSYCLGCVLKGQTNLYLACPEIGPGLFLQHAFSTIIAAQRVGNNCWVNQQVTIGYNGIGNLPSLGNNVTVRAGAKIIGAVSIGNDVVVGANAVVVKNVPDGCVVVGVPAYIIRRNGRRVKEPL